MKLSFTTYSTTVEETDDGTLETIWAHTEIRTALSYASDLRGNITLSTEVFMFLVNRLKESK